RRGHHAELREQQPDSHPDVDDTPNQMVATAALIGPPRHHHTPPAETNQHGRQQVEERAGDFQEANSTASIWLMTVTLIWPGKVTSSEMRLAICADISTALASETSPSLT